MEQLNIGVIGTGRMGKNHVRILNELESANLVALSDTDKEQLGRITSLYKVKGYLNYQDMLSTEQLDAVVVAVPTTLHKRVALDVISHGIHLLIEKPIASTVEDAQEIIQKAKEKNVKLMIGHVERFNPAVQELKKRVMNNELGKIYKFAVERSSPFPSRVSDVGVVIDLAVHDLDVLNHINNSKVTQLYAQTDKRIHSTNEDMLHAQLSYENGVIGVLSVDWLTPVVIRKLSITGEKGMFVTNYLTQELYFYENQAIADPDFSSIVSTVTAGDMIKINIPKQEPLKIELASFISSIQHNTEPPVTGEEGILVLQLALKLIESAQTRSVVRL